MSGWPQGHGGWLRRAPRPAPGSLAAIPVTSRNPGGDAGAGGQVQATDRAGGRLISSLESFDPKQALRFRSGDGEGLGKAMAEKRTEPGTNERKGGTSPPRCDTWQRRGTGKQKRHPSSVTNRTAGRRGGPGWCAACRRKRRAREDDRLSGKARITAGQGARSPRPLSLDSELKNDVPGSYRHR